MLNALSVMAAHDRSREAQATAARYRLARIAACCRPAPLVDLIRKGRDAVARRLAERRGTRPAAVCCA